MGSHSPLLAAHGSHATAGEHLFCRPRRALSRSPSRQSLPMLLCAEEILRLLCCRFRKSFLVVRNGHPAAGPFVVSSRCMYHKEDVNLIYSQDLGGLIFFLCASSRCLPLCCGLPLRPSICKPAVGVYLTFLALSSPPLPTRPHTHSPNTSRRFELGATKQIAA